MNKELISRFFQGDCTPEEKKEIFQYFENNPAELDVYFSEEEWQEMLTEQELDASISDRMREQVLSSVSPKRNLTMIMRSVAVAAAVLLLVGAGWKYFSGKKEIEDIKQQTVATLITKENATDSVVIFSLPDGTLVELYPNSELSYLPSFNKEERKTFLKGVAQYDVAHDSSRPFSVVSSDLSTTALGTKFKVRAEKGKADLQVKLFSGSVVIRNASAGITNLDKDYYLKPGQAFFYYKERQLFGISTFKKGVKGTAKKHLNDNAGNSEAGSMNDWYMFNNQSLVMVFESLQEIYNVKIYYDAKELGGKSFIGKIEKNESVEKLLEDIAKLNGLTVKHNKNSFTFKKT